MKKKKSKFILFDTFNCWSVFCVFGSHGADGTPLSTSNFFSLYPVFNKSVNNVDLLLDFSL